ncbi:MAG TPA: phage major capsid protein, partial [Candidatus Methylacidiphilales bacterium]
MELLSPNVGFAEFLRSRAPIRGFENVTPPFGGGRFCPLQVLTRDMSAGVFSQGGALISSSVGDFTAPLRANSAVLKSGAQLKTGLVPPVGFPVGGNDLVASFVSEYATAVESDFSFSTAKMTPHRVVTQMTVSNQLLMQGTGDIAALFSAQAVLAIDAAIDKNCFVGGGGA